MIIVECAVLVLNSTLRSNKCPKLGSYRPLLWRAVAALLAGSVLVGVQRVAAARRSFGRYQLLAAGPPSRQVHPSCTPQLQAHMHAALKHLDCVTLESNFNECYSSLFTFALKMRKVIF